MATPPVIDSGRYFCEVRLASFRNFTPDRTVTSEKVGRAAAGAPSRRLPAREPSRNERRVKGEPGKAEGFILARGGRRRRAAGELDDGPHCRPALLWRRRKIPVPAFA